jgi:hypothetical protein
VTTVEYLGAFPMQTRTPAWARFQIDATGSTREAAFRITRANGKVSLVMADSYRAQQRLLLEAKLGDLGQMFNSYRAKHIMTQAQNYLDIASATDSRVIYLVSSRLGASRLQQRFGLDFGQQIASGQLEIHWLHSWR